MVAARADVEHRFGMTVQVHRRDDGDVGQVRAAVIRVVQHVHVARVHGATVAVDDGADALAHAAQMHRHVRRVGDQVAGGVEQRARKVQPLLDVDRVRGVLQLQPHLFGNGHEQVVEHFQQHRIDLGAGGKALGARCGALEQQVVQRRHLRAPAGLQHGGGVALGDDGRAFDRVARPQVLAHDQRGVVPGALSVQTAGVHAHGVAARSGARRVQRSLGFGGRIARHHGLDRHGLDDQRLALHQKGKALAVRRLEGLRDGLHRQRVGGIARGLEGHDQGRVGAGVTHVQPPVHLHRASARPARLQGVACLVRQSVQRRAQRRDVAGGQRQLQRLLAHQVLVGQAHAVGRQHAGQRVHQHAVHAQRIGHRAGVLAAGAAKALQRVARHVVAARHADLLDGAGHLLHGDLDEAVRHVLGRAAGGLRHLGKAGANHLGIQRLVGVVAKHLGEVRGLQLARHHVGVRQRQRPAAAVAGGPGVGAGAVGPHAKARAVKAQDRAAARGHGVDAHHRRTHAHAGHLGLELALELAGKVAHVGAGAAHVEADDLVLPGNLRGPGHAHDAAGRAGQDRVLALKGMRVGQPARRLHEEQRHARHLRRHLIHIATQDGRQIGIDHGGVAAADELHQRAGLMGAGDLRKAQLLRDAGGGLLMRVVAPAVHEDNRNAAQPALVLRKQLLFQ